MVNDNITGTFTYLTCRSICYHEYTSTKIGIGLFIIEVHIIKKVIHSCVKCYRFRKINYQQIMIMANIPTLRVTQAYAFKHAGIDLAGPLNIKYKRHRYFTMSYLASFVYLTTETVRKG